MNKTTQDTYFQNVTSTAHSPVTQDIDIDAQLKNSTQIISDGF
jgi:hypothetical protein